MKYTLLIRKRNGMQEEPVRISFDNTSQIKSFIKNISTKDLEQKEYFFIKKDDLPFFFFETYNQEFYEITTQAVILKKMPNGLRREKKYHKKLNFNNKILNRALKRIEEDLSIHNITLDRGAFDNTTKHQMTFYQKEGNQIVNVLKVEFDKVMWRHHIDFVKSENPKDFITIVEDTIKKYTLSTHKVRKRMYYGNNSK